MIINSRVLAFLAEITTTENKNRKRYCMNVIKELSNTDIQLKVYVLHVFEGVSFTQTALITSYSRRQVIKIINGFKKCIKNRDTTIYLH